MTAVHAAAPGKMMLSGEYAVLRGAPAVVMAVDRSVTVNITPSSDSVSRLWARPLHEQPFEFDLKTNPDESHFWLQPDRAEHGLGITSRLLPQLMRLLHKQASDQCMDIKIDSSALYGLDPEGHTVKYGLGSSAATTVALFRALSRQLFHPIIEQPRRHQLDTLLPLYRQALQSAASGADLAASLYGGLVCIQARADGLEVEPLQWPADLHWKGIWTYTSAQTTNFVARFNHWSKQSVGAEDLVSSLSENARGVQSAFASGRTADLIRLLRQFSDALQTMDDAIVGSSDDPVRIVSAKHAQLRQMATLHGVLYKSCGAGGGDLGIAISSDTHKLEGFVNALSPSCARPLELRIASVV